MIIIALCDLHILDKSWSETLSLLEIWVHDYLNNQATAVVACMGFPGDL